MRAAQSAKGALHVTPIDVCEYHTLCHIQESTAMSQTAIIFEQIRKKEREIHALERKLGEAQIYLQALKDLTKVMQKEEVEAEAADGTIREGSTVDQARKAIASAGRALHLDEILKALGKEITRESKASLNGSLAAYVRKSEVFTRPKPSTYGLVEFPASDDDDVNEMNEPPSGFGSFADDIDDDIPF
jgi:hypothetical protein